jgi:hypothetical protein
MPPRSQPESKQGLIITMVIAFLLVICLGVTTWFGYSEQDRFDKAAKEAKRNEDTFKAERDYYKAQAMMYRAYMGMSEGMDGADTLETRKRELDGSLGQSNKDKADVTKTLKALESKYGWNGNQPRETLEGTINTLRTQYENLANKNKKTEDDLKKAKLDLQRREEDLANARKEFEDNLKTLTEKFKQDFTKSDEQLAQFRASVESLSQQREKEKTDADNAKKDSASKLEAKERDIQNLKNLVKRKDDDLAAIQAKSPESPANMRTDWKITYMDNRGTNPYISLGSDDRVKPRLTFNIHGVGSDGRPNPQSKGTLEVVKVLGPHLSQARVTSVKNPSRNPIVVNDVIYNASWNPNIKKHVAIAGVIDLTGDGRDSLNEFMRNLERQNIVVDAYVNPKDGQLVGQLTYQTDYLILGGTSDRAYSSSSDENDKRVLEGRKQIQEEAKKYGVPVKSLLSYLEMIGYPLPHATRDSTSSPYNTGSRSDIVPRLSRDQFPPKAPNGDKTPPSPPDK